MGSDTPVHRKCQMVCAYSYDKRTLQYYRMYCERNIVHSGPGGPTLVFLNFILKMVIVTAP